MINFDFFDLEYNSRNWDISYDIVDGSALRMSNHINPISIKYSEFIYIHDYIIDNNLKVGYEVATAFGISSLAAGLAFKDNEGKLLTVDAYIEEHYNAWDGYTDKKEYYIDSDGYKSVNKLIEHFSLEDVIYPKVGWSPDDIPTLLDNFLVNNELLDYMFIDAAHFDDNIIEDIEVLKPYMSNEFTIFIHDSHAFTDKLDKYLFDSFRANKNIIPECVIPNGFNLSILRGIK